MHYDNLQIDQSTAAAFTHTGMFKRGSGNFDWHAHRWPHLLYAVSGALTVETEESLWLLPPQRAAWVAADVAHKTTCLLDTHFTSVFISPTLLTEPLPTRVFAVTPLAREMIRYARRWGVRRNPDDELAQQYFSTLIMMTRQWMADEIELRLPRPKSEPMQQVVEYILRDLDAADLNEAARLISVSSRTLRRQMLREMQTTWRQFLRDARMMQAMELLAAGQHSVTEVALAVGYNSHSAFTHAFHHFTGQNPSEYLACCVIESDQDN
ncbi:MAG: helix-turn-helix transcriptional regulator [Ardenticatenaceae bacterium]|nr:helix-turn-helix transcriptional regulator [Ardenticatenaceae bacterium]